MNRGYTIRVQHFTCFACALLTLPMVVSAKAATYGQEVVAAVLMGEASVDKREGMLAVAEVIRTRADHWNISPLAVVKKKRHFSCLNNTTPEELIRKFKGKQGWETALEISRMMYNEPEKLPGIAKGATHYDCGIPYWAEGKTPVAQIGGHAFYRLPLP